MRTQDGRLRVYLYTDQTGEISDGRGVLIVHRTVLFRIGQYLDKIGIGFDDLVPD